MDGFCMLCTIPHWESEWDYGSDIMRKTCCVRRSSLADIPRENNGYSDKRRCGYWTSRVCLADLITWQYSFSSNIKNTKFNWYTVLFTDLVGNNFHPNDALLWQVYDTGYLSGGCLNVKMPSYQYKIHMLKQRRSHGLLFFNLSLIWESHTLGRRSLSFTGPWTSTRTGVGQSKIFLRYQYLH